VIHLGDDIIIPDLVGYRVERAPRPQDEAFVTIVPDWVCEYLGPKRDTSVRVAKMLAYARAGVPHSWILDPLDQTLDVLKLSAERQWLMMDVFDERTGRTRVCAEPFNAIEFDLAILWHSVPPRPTSRGVST
jgi:Uma2 family endonuclease